MATIANWLKRLLGQPKQPDDAPVYQSGDLHLVPAGQTAVRAERALPGTGDLEPLLHLTPPPVDPELVNDPNAASDRDYGPSPIAEWSLTFEAQEQFDCAALAKTLRAGHDSFARPMHHVRTPEGRVTYLSSADAPPRGVALIPAWSLGEWSNPDKEKIFAGAHALQAALSALPQGFQAPEFSLHEIERQLEQAAEIVSIAPKRVQIVASHPEGAFWNGRDIWTLLHRLGLKWADMDCFQWADSTYQTDYLIWVEVDDGKLGYALPEQIAAGTQNFRAVIFSLEILRCPSPAHVLGELERMTAAFQTAMPCRLTARLDDTVASDPQDLRDRVAKVVEALCALGFKPGSESVCRLT